MEPQDIKVGMYLKNESNKGVPLYDNLDGTGDITLTVAPGELIGQVVKVSSGPNGVVYDFTSEAINAHVSWLKRMKQNIKPALMPVVSPFFLLSWIANGQVPNYACGVRFKDLQAAVSDAQVAQQATAIAQVEATGFSLKNQIKEAAGDVADVVSSAIPSGLIWSAVGVFVLMNWNKFFKPTTIR